MGISYGGISQLFVAATDPPDLAAIAPLSVLDSSATTLYPGGILNTGFAVGLGRGPPARRPARLADRRPAVGAAADPAGRSDLQAQPGAPRRGAKPARQGPRQLPLRPRGRRPAGPDHLREAGSTCRATWPASGPTSRPAGTAPTSPSTSPARGTSGSRSPTASTATRSTRRPSTASSISSSSTWRGGRRSCRRSSGPARRPCTRPRSACRTSRCRRTRSSRSGPTRPRWPRSSAWRRSGSCSTTAPAGRRPGQPLPGFEDSFSRFPIPGTQARSWYLGRRRDAGGRQAGDRRRRPVHLEPARPAGDRLHRTRRRHHPRRPVDGDADLQLDPEPARDRGLLRQRPAGGQHGGDRRRRRPAVGQGLGAERRPAGDRVRGPPGRQGDVRPERLAAGQRAQARPRPAPCSTPVPTFRAADVRPLPRGRFAEVTVPLYYEGHAYRRRLADPDHGLGAGRRPAGVGLLGDPAVGTGHGADRPLAAVRVAAGAAGGAGRAGADAAAAVPGAARRAVPGATRRTPTVRCR